MIYFYFTYQNIPSGVHIVAVDLPGHGFTSDPEKEDDIGFKGQVKRVRQVNIFHIFDIYIQVIHFLKMLK